MAGLLWFQSLPRYHLFMDILILRGLVEISTTNLTLEGFKIVGEVCNVMSWRPSGLIVVTHGFGGYSSIIISSLGLLTDNAKSIPILGSGLSDKLNLYVHQNYIILLHLTFWNCVCLDDLMPSTILE